MANINDARRDDNRFHRVGKLGQIKSRSKVEVPIPTHRKQPVGSHDDQIQLPDAPDRKTSGRVTRQDGRNVTVHVCQSLPFVGMPSKIGSCLLHNIP